jgi:hypothetical protein
MLSARRSWKFVKVLEVTYQISTFKDKYKQSALDV